MVTSIDAYLQQRRFQNPRLISEFDGSYAPRDLKEYKPDAEDEWTNHTDIKNGEICKIERELMDDVTN